MVGPERNNFDLFRIVTGIGIVLVHISILSGQPALAPIEALEQIPLVQTFFVLSAYLVMASYERSKGLRRFAGARARRILPAYLTVVLLCGLLLPANGGRWGYLAANLSFLNFLQPILPGVFANNPQHIVNGSLWTIKVEIMFYLCVPLLAYACRRVPPWMILIPVYLLSVGWTLSMLHWEAATGRPIFHSLANQLPGYASYMTVGALVHYYRASFERFMAPLVILAICAIAGGAMDEFGLLSPLVTGVLTLAFCLGRYLGPWGKYGDFSYGLYLYHFPIIQLLVASGWAEDRPWLFLATALALAGLAAVLSWHLIEKRFLRRSRASPPNLDVREDASISKLTT